MLAKYEPALQLVKLQSRIGGTAGNDIALAIETSEDAGIVAGASGAFLQGGQNATVIAPGTLVTMIGTNLAALAAIGDGSGKNLPLELG